MAFKCDWLDQAVSHRKDPWVNFTDDPNGDYTMDSGNAEQLILSMEHLARHVLGVDLREANRGYIRHGLWIGARWMWRVGVTGWKRQDGTVGYSLQQTNRGTSLNVTRMPAWEMEISLPVQKGRPIGTCWTVHRQARKGRKRKRSGPDIFSTFGTKHR